MKIKQEKFQENKPYKPDPKMIEAAKRAASHPRPVSMTTKIDYVPFIR